MSLNSFDKVFLIPFYMQIIHISIANYDPNDCHFAQSYTANDLFESSQLQKEFLLRASWWQGAFARQGLGRFGSLTLHGIEMEFDSSLPWNNLFAGRTQGEDGDPMDEAFHLALLAAALDGDAYAMEFFRSSMHHQSTTLNDFIIDMLRGKIRLYQKFNQSYPGYGGYLPFFTRDREGLSIVPSRVKTIFLYSYSFFTWAMIAVAQVLQEKNHTDLSIAYNDYVKLMAKTGLTIFYRRKTVASRMQIINVTADVARANYKLAPVCIRKPETCDPGAGFVTELFFVFIFLYGNWIEEYGGQKARNNLFKLGLHPARFATNNDSIIVEKRSYFEADELMKYLFLPYLDIPICEQLFLNANRVSTIYSSVNKYPGLFASGTQAVTDAMYIDFASVSPGIPGVSFNKLTKNDVVMPHAAFPLFLHPASWKYGVVWYANMLNSTVSQTSLGAMDTIKMTGDFTSLSMMWYTGPLNVLAFGGGLSAIIRRYLKSTGTYKNFYRFYEQSYNSIFQHKSVFNTSRIPFALPSKFMPKVGTNRKCDPDIKDFDKPYQFCITWGTWERCYLKTDLIRATLNLSALPFIILVLYISIVKHRNEAAVHKYFTLHLFIVHLLTAVIWPSMLITVTFFPSAQDLFFKNNDFTNYRNYIDRYYVTHCFTLIMSLTLFSMASAFLLPFFYKRWMSNGKKWNCYVLICHVISMFATYPGGLFDYVSDETIRRQNNSYVFYITASFYGLLFCMAFATIHVIFQMKKRAKTEANNGAKQMEIKALVSSLLYAIVPTIWCLGSQVSDFFFLLGLLRKLEVIVFYYTLEEVEYYFRASYPLAHSIATLVGLGPYRRSVVKMIRDWKKKNDVIPSC